MKGSMTVGVQPKASKQASMCDKSMLRPAPTGLISNLSTGTAKDVACGLVPSMYATLHAVLYSILNPQQHHKQLAMRI